jgi:hypothetical protein
MNPTTFHVSELELEALTAEAIALGKRDARAGVVSRGIDDMPEGLEVAFDRYLDALEHELLVMGTES